MQNSKIDIWSKGEVASHLSQLADSGQIKKCKHLMLEYGHAKAYYPRCAKDWASREPARNVPLDRTAYSGPSSYFWPKCPTECPHFERAENFLVSVSRDQFDEGVTSINEESVEAQPTNEESAEAQPTVKEASEGYPALPDEITISPYKHPTIVGAIITGLFVVIVPFLTWYLNKNDVKNSVGVSARHVESAVNKTVPPTPEEIEKELSGVDVLPYSLKEYQRIFEYPPLTILQKDELYAPFVGRKVIWEGTIDWVVEREDGSILVSIKALDDENGKADMNDSAAIEFEHIDKDKLLLLNQGQKIRISGVIQHPDILV